MTRDHDFDDDRMADALRASLSAHAQDAPRGEMLAGRIIDVASRQPMRPESSGRRWGTWALPLVAAAAVAGVVGAVVGVENYHPHSSHIPVANSRSPHLPTPVQPTRVATFAPSSVSTATTAPVDTSTLHGVKILDITFAGQDDGWALASADCIRVSGRCPALLRTTDGKNWTSMPGTQFNVPGTTTGCATRCVQHIRFATDSVGYAYGPNALLMTTDGGASWKPQPGGAIALESLDNNVIRVTASSPSGCPGPCAVRVETADIGSTVWRQAPLVPQQTVDDIAFSRGQPSNAYLLLRRNPAGGGNDETSTLYRSTDNGAGWQRVGEPCPQLDREVDSYAVTGGGSGRVSVLCATRGPSPRWFVATSTNGGASFSPQPATVPAGSTPMLTGDPTTVLVTAGDGLARSTDGGQTWHRVAGVTGQIGFVGFESATVGRAVSKDGRTIWTTRDAGKSWQAVPFG